MSTKTRGGASLTLVVVGVVMMIVGAYLAVNLPTRDDTLTRDRRELTLAATIYRRFGDVTPRVQVQVLENEKKTYDREHTSNWSRTYRVAPGTKIELRVYYVDAVIEAHCVIFDTNGHVHDDDQVLFLQNALSTPAACKASVL